eukprot:g6471.t1
MESHLLSVAVGILVLFQLFSLVVLVRALRLLHYHNLLEQLFTRHGPQPVPPSLPEEADKKKRKEKEEDENEGKEENKMGPAGKAGRNKSAAFFTAKSAAPRRPLSVSVSLHNAGRCSEGVFKPHSDNMHRSRSMHQFVTTVACPDQAATNTPRTTTRAKPAKRITKNIINHKQRRSASRLSVRSEEDGRDGIFLISPSPSNRRQSGRFWYRLHRSRSEPVPRLPVSSNSEQLEGPEGGLKEGSIYLPTERYTPPSQVGHTTPGQEYLYDLQSCPSPVLDSSCCRSLSKLAQCSRCSDSEPGELSCCCSQQEISVSSVFGPEQVHVENESEKEDDEEDMDRFQETRGAKPVVDFDSWTDGEMVRLREPLPSMPSLPTISSQRLLRMDASTDSVDPHNFGSSLRSRGPQTPGDVRFFLRSGNGEWCGQRPPTPPNSTCGRWLLRPPSMPPRTDQPTQAFKRATSPPPSLTVPTTSLPIHPIRNGRSLSPSKKNSGSRSPPSSRSGQVQPARPEQQEPARTDARYAIPPRAGIPRSADTPDQTHYHTNDHIFFHPPPGARNPPQPNEDDFVCRSVWWSLEPPSTSKQVAGGLVFHCIKARMRVKEGHKNATAVSTWKENSNCEFVYNSTSELSSRTWKKIDSAFHLSTLADPLLITLCQSQQLFVLIYSIKNVF